MDQPVRPTPPSPEEADELVRIATRAAYSAGISGPDIPDVVQMTVEKLLIKWNSQSVVSARDSTRRERWHGYIAATTRNTYKDFVRSNDRRRERERRSAPGPLAVALPNRPGVRRPLPATISNVDRYLARVEIVQAIEDLEISEARRKVLRLHFIDGLNTDEIARVMRISRQMAARHKRLGATVLREYLLP